MSFNNQIPGSSTFVVLPVLHTFIPLKNIQLSLPQKITAVSLTLGVAVIGLLARYLRRRSRKPANPDISRRFGKRGNPSTLGSKSSTNGDVSVHGSGMGRRSASPGGRALHRRSSVVSVASGWLSGSTPAGSIIGGATGLGDAAARLTPQQLGLMGIEALDTAVNYWEDALAAYEYRGADTDVPLAVTGAEEAEFCREIQTLLDAAYELQNQSELLFLDQRSVLFRTESSARNYGGTTSIITGSPESFVSAQDEVADLREFEEFAEVMPDFDSLFLYQSALRHYEEFGVPYRVLRTEMVHCGSDLEYLCKTHCVRLGFQHLFRQEATYQWFADCGRQVLTDMLLFADRDPKDFLIAYEEMQEFLHDPNNWSVLEQELHLRGVKALTFYDVVMDYFLMDSFEDLETPPSSVTAVVQNRWLSNSFKETALATAVWSVLKAKRRMLKFPNGFMSHFYAISEHLSPLLAWGFLGPDENLREMCHHFREQVMSFLKDVFSFHKTRYTTIEELSADLLAHMKGRLENITQRLQS